MADLNQDGTSGPKERTGTETSIWKKEISFADKPAASAAAPPLVAPAVPEPVAPEPVVAEPVVAEPVAAEPVEEPVVSASAVEPVVAEPVVAEPVAVEPVAVEPLVVPEPMLPEAVVAEPAVVEAEPVVEAELVAPAPVAPEPVVSEVLLPGPVASEPVVEPVAVEAIAAEPPLPPVVATDDAAALPQSGDYGWLTQDLDENGEPKAGLAAESAAVVPAATPAPAPAPVELPPAPVELPPAAAAEPTVEVPVAEVSVPGAAEAKVPFWKKDVSLSRKPKTEKAPKAAKIPKAERAAKEKSAPFWKKELGKKKTAAPVAAAAEAAAPGEQAAEKPKPVKAKSVPFWKKELGKKGDKAAKEPKRKQAPGVKSLPFWKKDFSLGKSSDAARSAPIDRGAAKKKGKASKKQMVVGLKIGASQLAAARVVNNGSPELVQVARETLDDGIIVGGELRDPETLAIELASFFAKHKLPKKNVRLGIANNRIGVRTFEINGIDDPRQLNNAIRFRAQETLPIPLEEAVLDWQVLSETRDEDGGKTRRVLLVVAYRELVDRYVAACKKAGIRLSGIDLEAFAMLRAVIPPPPPGSPEPDGVSVVINVGHDRSTLAVSDGHVCEFTRVLSWGGQSLSVAIARAIDMTPSEVESLKLALTLGGTVTAPDSFSQEQTDAAAEAVTRELQAFARELVSSLRFYQNQPGSLGIQQIVLTGGTSHLPGLAAELERLIGVAVRVGDPLGRVKLGKRFKDPEQLGSYTVAVGLGIDD